MNDALVNRGEGDERRIAKKMKEMMKHL